MFSWIIRIIETQIISFKLSKVHVLQHAEIEAKIYFLSCSLSTPKGYQRFEWALWPLLLLYILLLCFVFLLFLNYVCRPVQHCIFKSLGTMNTEESWLAYKRIKLTKRVFRI